MLRDALEASPLVLLAAPFGYGKSALVDRTLHGRDDVALFRAQPWHHAAFIEDLVLAVRAARADFGRDTVGSATANADAALLARSFLADLRHVPGTLTLAIDNTEHLADDPAFTSFIEIVANDVPKEVHLLLVGRALPRLRAQTLVRTRAVTVPSDALLFSEEELALALEAHGIAQDDATAERLAHATKGWPASVSLTLLSGDLAFEYVAEGLLSELDADARSFLARIAVFEHIQPSMLENDSAYPHFAELLERIQRMGAPLGRDQSGYTLHPLVREVALKELDQSGKLSEAHATAARAFARHGNLAAALFHIRESGDESAADAFLREFGTSVVRTGNIEAICGALDLLRSETAQDVRAYLNALLSKNTGDEKTAAYLETAAASEDVRIAFGARAEQIERSIARNGSADPQALSDLARRAETLGPEARARAAIFQAWSAAVSLQFDHALDILEPLHSVDDAGTRFNTGVLSAYVHASLGQGDTALAELDGLARLFENDDRVIFEALALVWQARIALLLGRIAIAGDAARAALRVMERLGIRAEEAALYFALTELATHEGDVAQTVAFAERLSATAPNAWYSGDTVRARAFAEVALARAAFLGRDIQTARDLAIRAAQNLEFPLVQRAGAYAEAVMYASLLGDENTKGMYEYAAETTAQALPRDSADAVALATAADLLAFLAGIHEWASPAKLSQLDPFRGLLDARRGLVTVEHAAIAFRNLRTVKATQEPFNAALAQMARDGQRFDVRLLRAFVPRDRTIEAAPNPDGFDLTARELEILALLVEGLSNKEIAQRLVVSPRTVETHVERVLGKLEVGSRARAIAKALRLGIVTLAEF